MSPTLPFVCLLLALGTCTYVPDIPLFVYAGEAFISPHNKQITGHYKWEDIEELVDSFWLTPEQVGDAFLRYVNFGRLNLFHAATGNHPIELVVLVFPAKLRTQEMAKYSHLMPTLKKKMENSASFYSPYISGNPNKPEFSISAARAAKAVGKSGATTYFIGSEELLETLQERARAKPRVLETFEEWRAEDGEQETCRLTFLNGRPDLLIMQIEGSTAEESLTEAERKISAMHQFFDRYNFTQYVVLFTGDLSSPLEAELSENILGVPKGIQVPLDRIEIDLGEAKSDNVDDMPVENEEEVSIFESSTFQELKFFIGVASVFCILFLILTCKK